MDRMEQDIVCAFVAADCSLSDEDVCEDISECVHAECAAFFGREQARQHGVHVEKVVHSFRPKSELERSNVGSISSMRRGIRRAGPVDGKATGLVIKPARILLEIGQYLAARRGRGVPTGAEACRKRTKSTRRARINRKVQGNAHPSGRERNSIAKLALRKT